MSRTPKHAKPSSRRNAVRTTAAIAAAVAVTGLAGAAAGQFNITPANAATLNAAQRTCQAYAAWTRNPTRGHLRTLITDSLYVPWNAPGSKYGLGSDVYGLGADVLAGKTQYVSKDAGYVSKDCAGN